MLKIRALLTLVAIVLLPAAALAETFIPDFKVNKDAAVDSTKKPCGNVGYVGCCVDETHSQYCDPVKGMIEKTCVAPKGTCGWVNIGGKDVYSCTTSAASDPNNKYPRMCSAIPDAGIPDPDWGPKADKAIKEAGPKADAPPVVSCGTIGSAGCCADDSTVKYCTGGSLKTKTCSGTTPSCGWNKTGSGYFCGTTTDADPSGANPRLCSAAKIDGGGGKKDVGSAVRDSGKSSDGTTTKKDANTSNPSNPSTKEDGCSCSIKSSAPAVSLLLVVGLFFVFTLARRRRR